MNDSHDTTTRVKITALGEGDQTLGQRAEPLCLRLGGGDAAMLEQRSGQVGQHEPLVRRASAEAGTLSRRRHWGSPVERSVVRRMD